MRIALADIARAQAPRLRQLLPRDEIVELGDAAAGADGVDVLIASRFGPAEASRTRFRLLQVPGAGLDKVDLDAVPPEAWICNAYGHEGPIAEYVLAALLEATVGLTGLARQIPEKGWTTAYFSRRPHGELAGKTVGLMGLGHIGQAIARRAKAFDMRVMAIAARRRESAPDVDWIATPDRLGEMLAAADFVVVACPLNAATLGALGARELARMKSGAVLVNIARAEIVVEQDLYAALKEGRIGGAVLDAWYAYPASIEQPVEPSRFPFADLPNVRMTAHSAAWTEGVWVRRCELFAENIARLKDGRPPLNVVRAPSA